MNELSVLVLLRFPLPSQPLPPYLCPLLAFYLPLNFLPYLSSHIFIFVCMLLVIWGRFQQLTSFLKDIRALSYVIVMGCLVISILIPVLTSIKKSVLTLSTSIRSFILLEYTTHSPHLSNVFKASESCHSNSSHHM